MELSLDLSQLTPELLTQLCDFRDWLHSVDTLDGSSYDEARMLCRDFGDYISGRWQTTPSRAQEVILGRMHDLVFTLNRHGFRTEAGILAEDRLRIIVNSL